MDQFRKKYLKYKTKYVNLKNIVGGANTLSIQNPIYKNINLNSVAKKINPADFALAIDFVDYNGTQRHITLVFFSGFPINQNNNEPIKSILSEIVIEWYQVISTIMPQGGYYNYDISKANTLYHNNNGNSIWFIPNQDNFGIVSPYSLDSMIKKFLANLNSLKITKNWNFIINNPHGTNINNQNIFAHSDLKLKNQTIQSNMLKNLLPSKLDLTNVNIY